MCIEYRPIIFRNILFMRELLFYDIFHNCFNCIVLVFHVHYIYMNFLSEINIIYIHATSFYSVQFL